MVCEAELPTSTPRWRTTSAAPRENHFTMEICVMNVIACATTTKAELDSAAVGDSQQHLDLCDAVSNVVSSKRSTLARIHTRQVLYSFSVVFVYRCVQATCAVD